VLDPEISATAIVLSELIQGQTGELPEVAFGAERLGSAQEREAVLIVILSKECLTSTLFAGMLIKAHAHWPSRAAIVSVVADKGFVFPAKEDVIRRIAPSMAQALKVEQSMEVPPKVVADCYCAVLHILALVFSSHLSMDILQTEVAMICRRMDKAAAHLRDLHDDTRVALPDPKQKIQKLSGLCRVAATGPQELAKHRMGGMAAAAPVLLLRSGAWEDLSNIEAGNSSPGAEDLSDMEGGNLHDKEAGNSQSGAGDPSDTGDKSNL